MPDPTPNAPDPGMRDLVTSLPNRRALLASLRERIQAGRGALVLLDLDQWRRVCDRLSREQLEKLLRDVSERFRQALPAGAELYRYAGDAFALHLPEADREQGAAAAETLRAALAAAPFKLAESRGATMVATRLTASGAAAAYPLDGRSPALLIETTELALTVAKHQGRNRIAIAGSLDPAALGEIGVYRGLPCPVLVGRIAEQTRLRQAASDTRHVGPTAALIQSPPGFGKSRLLRELTRWARNERFVVMGGICQEPRASLPYAVLSDLVETLLLTDRGLALDVLKGLSPAHRAALAVVVRDLPGAGGGAAPELADAGRLLFEAFGSLLDGLARAGPLFLAVDEAEFADAASLEAVAGAFNRRIPVFVVFATAQVAVDFAPSPAAEFLKARGNSVLRVGLEPLSAADLQTMLHAILPEAEFAREALENLVLVSKGNPLHLEETIRALLLKGRIRMKDGKWILPTMAVTDLPGDLEAAIRAVSESLPARANTLLAGAAVLGPQVDAELLHEVMGHDEMELLDLLDEARRSRLLAAAETGSELLAFPAAHVRKLRLEASAAEDRKQIHERVGVVQEARHGGDVSHLADELAYHYGQAGNEARSRHFDTVARRRAMLLKPPEKEGVRRARLDPVREALAPAAQEHALHALRFFSGALRVGRLYPKSSNVSATFVTQLKATLRSLFSEGPGFTVAVTPDGVVMNGEKNEAGAIGDFAALLEERLIESVTILRTFDPERIGELLDAFAEPFSAVTAPADFWDRFLAKKDIEGLDIVQRAYQTRDREKKGAIVRGEDPVPPGEFPELLAALRQFKAAVDNVKLYPPGHSLVEETSEQATRFLLHFLGRVPALTLGTSEGDLVINGAAGDRKFFGDIGAWIVKEIDQRALWSVSVWKGLTGDEVRSLVGFFASAPGGTAAIGDKLLSQLKHASFGSRQYERAAEGAEEVVLEPPPKPIRSEIRAREFLAQGYEAFLSPQLEEAFPTLVEALAYGARRPLAEQLVERLGTHFHDTSLRHRRQAYDLLARSLAFASPSCRQVEISRSCAPLKKRLLEDSVPKAFRAAADILPIWIPAAVTATCLKELAEITGPVLRKRADPTDAPAEIAAAAEAALQLIPGTGAFPVLLAAVRRAKQDERALAVGVLLAIGGAAVQRLVELVVDEPDLAARQATALGMSLVAPQVAPELARALAPDAPVERFRRLFEVIDSILSPELAAHLAGLVETGTPVVRQEILAGAGKLPPSVTVGIVKRLSASAKAPQRDQGIEMAARLGVAEVCADLGAMLEKADDEALMRLLCRYFAAVPNPAIVPALARIATFKPKFFGLKKGYQPETRAEAARALAKAGTKEALEAFGRAAADAELKELLKDVEVPAPKPA